MSTPISPTSPYGTRPPLAVLQRPLQPPRPPFSPSYRGPVSPTHPYGPHSGWPPAPPPQSWTPTPPQTHQSSGPGSGSQFSLTPSQAAHLLGRPLPTHRPATPLGLPLPLHGLPTPAQARAALTLSTTSGQRTLSEPEEYTDHLTLKEFAALAQRLGEDSLVTRITSDDSRHPVIFLHFTHQEAVYYARIRRPYSPITALVRSWFGLSSPAAVVLSNVDLPERQRKKVKLLIYPWRAHYPTLDPANPLQLPLLSKTEDGGRLSRLLNALGNGQTYALKPPLRLRDVADLALEAQQLTPRCLPNSFKQRFFAWHVLSGALEHFGHELFVTYRKSVHPDFVLGLQWDLKQYGSYASAGAAAAVLGCTLIAYLPLFVMLGFLFHARRWPIGGILYLLIALPVGILSPLPDYLLRLWAVRVRTSIKRFRARLTAEIRRVHGGHAYAEMRSTTQWSLSGPVGNIDMHSPLFPYLAKVDLPLLPENASLPPMDLRAFLSALKSRPSLANSPVTALQARQGRGSPFLKSYLLFFINLEGQDMALRVDPPGKKLSWWRPYEHTVLPSLVQITSVAADDAAQIIEDAGSGATGSHILFTLNSWKTAFIDIDPRKAEQLISLAAQSRAAHRRLTSLTDTPARLADYPTPTLIDALRAVQEASDEFHPAYSGALSMLRTTLAVTSAFALAYSSEYLPSVGNGKAPIHPLLFMQDPFVLQHHRAMIRQLNMLTAVLFYALLLGLAFITPGDYNRFMLANTTIIFAVMCLWFSWQRIFWPAWLGSVESGIDRIARWLVDKHLPKAEPLPRGAYFPATEEGEKPIKPMNWDIPPTGLEQELEQATTEWAQRMSSRMASSSRMPSSGLAPSSRFPSSVRIPQPSREPSAERPYVEERGRPMRDLSGDSRR